MSISPQKQREILFLLLYSSDFGSEAEVIDLLMQQLSVTKKAVRAAMQQCAKALEYIEALDLLIEEHSKAYALERIPRVERTILRLCLYELLCLKTTPYKVVFAEAARLTRKFATKEAAAFVNAILETIYSQRKVTADATISSEPISAGATP